MFDKIKKFLKAKPELTESSIQEPAQPVVSEQPVVATEAPKAPAQPKQSNTMGLSEKLCERYDIDMTDDQANIFVRNKLKRAQKWYGPKLIDYYERKCMYAKNGCHSPCYRCPKFELVAFTIGNKITLYSPEHKIRIKDKNGVNVYKMDEETWDLAYHIKHVLDKKEWHRSCVKDELLWNIGCLAPLIIAIFFIIGIMYLCDKEKQTYEQYEQEKVIQDKVDSLNMIKTMYLNDNLRPITQ